MNTQLRPAPDWQVQQWFNTSTPPTVQTLRGKVIVLEAFQMLCPGCVSHGLPQASRVSVIFPPEHVAVIGLHTVFEHHQAMTPVSLQAFLHEYRIAFPVGVDVADTQSPIPRTMGAYAMRGTPTLILIDTRGFIRYQHFGQIGDLLLGAQIAELMGEATGLAQTATEPVASALADCTDEGCIVMTAQQADPAA